MFHAKNLMRLLEAVVMAKKSVLLHIIISLKEELHSKMPTTSGLEILRMIDISIRVREISRMCRKKRLQKITVMVRSTIFHSP